MTKIVQRQLNSIIPYENNPRINDGAVEAVANSIREYGFKVPIIIDKDNVIVAGHTRYKASQKLGLDEVPCIVADDLTPEQIKSYRLVDNKVGEIAEWDMDLLQSELAELELLGIDLSDFGFGDIEPNEELLNDILEDEIPDIPNEPVTKLGDIWQLGKHRLICGDCTDKSTIDKLMDNEQADLIVTDPPYNVDYVGKTKDKLKIQNDKLDSKHFYEFLTNSFKHMSSALKDGGAFYIWHAESESEIFRKATREQLGKVRSCLIWNKNQFILGRQDYQWKHEPCLYGWKDGAAHYFIDSRNQSTIIEDKIDFKKLSKNDAISMLKELLSDKVATTVINEDKPSVSAEHPTMKPVKLIARLINNSSRKGEIVLDIFGGSGTTLIACEQLDRVCYMAEIDPKYCDVIVKRWEKLTKQKAVRI